MSAILVFVLLMHDPVNALVDLTASVIEINRGRFFASNSMIDSYDTIRIWRSYPVAYRIGSLFMLDFTALETLMESVD